MNGSFPMIDPRRAKGLYEELKTIASVALPEWQSSEAEGEFGDALLRIIARLSEHSTRRMDQTRDLTAFYRMLDIPADWARPATAPLAFLLSNDRNRSYLHRRVPAAASTDDGKFFPKHPGFTTHTGQINSSLADAKDDIIETSPPNFLALEEKQQQLPDYQVVTFAEGNRLLQIDPWKVWKREIAFNIL